MASAATLSSARVPMAQKSIELDAGISEYLWPSLTGFSCRFKERWQDFQVYEIDRSGVELHLSELITPGCVAAELKAASAARREARAAVGPGFSPDPIVEEELRAALGSESLEELWSFLRCQRTRPDSQSQEATVESSAMPEDQTKAQPAAKPPPFVDLNAEVIGNGSKEARKRAHRAILDHFGSFLNTETVEADGGARRLRVWMRDAELKVKTQAGGADARGDGSKGGGKDKSKHRGKGKGKDKGRSKGKDKGRSRAAQDDSVADSGGAAEGGSGEFGTFRREGWPKDRPDYLYFRLYKENIDTAEAVANISKCVGRSVKSFTFAGTKDRRASTVQKVCAYRLPADQLRRTLTHRLWDKRLRISDLAYEAERLWLGELQGNCFHVVLRGVPDAAVSAPEQSGKSSDVDSAFAAVKAGGFLNYFGLQRFGSRAIRTHHVGATIISCQWEKAVRLIMGDEALIPSSALRKRQRVDSHEVVDVSCGDNILPPAKRARSTKTADVAEDVEPDSSPSIEGKDSKSAALISASNDVKLPRWQLISNAQQLYLQTGDAHAALEIMPKSQHLERCILGALARHLSPADTLRQLPHQALALYAHAAQGLVWNAILSHRVREHGAKPIVGDLIFVEDASSARSAVTNDAKEKATAAPSDSGIPDDEDAGDFACLGGEGADEMLVEEDGMLPSVRVLQTLEEAAEVKFSDVVLPLPGSEVQYPPNLRSTYENVARDLLGLSLTDFHESTLVQLRGGYRHVAVQPGSMEWRVVPAAEVQVNGKKPLMQTDVARLLALRGPVPSTDSKSLEVGCTTDRLEPEPAGSSEAQAGASPDPPPTEMGVPDFEAAVVFSCCLPPSAYLTMLLREVSKHVVE